jgi:hypothetical protein
MKVTAWLPKEPEPVFKAHSTGELSGTHRRLIRSALSDDEIRCLIVSPIWEAQEALCGIRAGQPRTRSQSPKINLSFRKTRLANYLRR